MYALNLNEENRVLSVTFDEFASANQPRVETIPEGNISDYLFIDGEFICDPLPAEEVVEEPTQLDKIEAQVAYTAMCTGTLLETI